MRFLISVEDSQIEMEGDLFTHKVYGRNFRFSIHKSGTAWVVSECKGGLRVTDIDPIHFLVFGSRTKRGRIAAAKMSLDCIFARVGSKRVLELLGRADEVRDERQEAYRKGKLKKSATMLA